MGLKADKVTVVDLDSGIPLKASTSIPLMINVSEPHSPTSSIVPEQGFVACVQSYNLPLCTDVSNLSNDLLSVDKANVLIDLGLSTIFNRLSLKRKFDSSWDSQYRAKFCKFSSFQEESAESTDRVVSPQGSSNYSPLPSPHRTYFYKGRKIVTKGQEDVR